MVYRQWFIGGELVCHLTNCGGSGPLQRLANCLNAFAFTKWKFRQQVCCNLLVPWPEFWGVSSTSVIFDEPDRISAFPVFQYGSLYTWINFLFDHCMVNCDSCIHSEYLYSTFSRYLLLPAMLNENIVKWLRKVTICFLSAGVTESIVLGIPMRIGTGCVKLLEKYVPLWF